MAAASESAHLIGKFLCLIGALKERLRSLGETNCGQEAPLSHLQTICYLESQAEHPDCLLFVTRLLLFRNPLDVSQWRPCVVLFRFCLQRLHGRMLIVDVVCISQNHLGVYTLQRVAII